MSMFDLASQQICEVLWTDDDMSLSKLGQSWPPIVRTHCATQHIEPQRFAQLELVDAHSPSVELERHLHGFSSQPDCIADWLLTLAVYGRNILSVCFQPFPNYSQ